MSAKQARTTEGSLKRGPFAWAVTHLLTFTTGERNRVIAIFSMSGRIITLKQQSDYTGQAPYLAAPP
jgi:hypothetical protein